MPAVKNRRRRVPAGRTGVPAQVGPRWRIVHLACGHPQKDQLAVEGDHVWCDACADFRPVAEVKE